MQIWAKQMFHKFVLNQPLRQLCAQAVVWNDGTINH